MHPAIYPFHLRAENKLTLFLKKKPTVKQEGIRKDLERGTFLLNLNFNLSDSFASNDPKSIEIESIAAQLMILDDKGETILADETALSSIIKLFTVLTIFQCDEVYAALSGQESKMYVRLKIYFHHNYILENIESFTRLDTLLHDTMLGGNQSSIMNINYKYFNPNENAYSDAPARYLVNGASRGVTTNAAFLNQNKITSMQFAASPLNASKLSASHLMITGKYNSIIGLDVLDDWEIATNQHDEIKDYPIVNNNTSDFWVNRNNNQEWLAIPKFSILQPGLNQEFKNAPFSFIFRNLGLGLDGKPVLEGEITLTISQEITDELKINASKSDVAKTIKLISLKTLNYTLSIPYIGSDQLPKNLLVTTQESNTAGEGKTKLIFRLNNNAVRICYSSISADNSQQGYLPLKLQIDFCFYGYSAENRINVNFSNVINSRISAIPLIRRNQRTIDQESYFDVITNRLVKKNGKEIQFDDVTKRDVSLNTNLTKVHTISRINNPYVSNVIRPDLILAQTSVLPLFPSVVYKCQTYQRSVELEVSFPCSTYGNFYQENNSETYNVVGCRQAYKLGDPPESLYTEITELRHDSYKIYRSTVSPNKFLISPISYIIGRHSPMENSVNNYKPCIILYSTINVVDNTSTWILDFTLMPDISISDRMELEFNLRNYTPYLPDIQYVTEIPVAEATAVLSISSMEGTTLTANPVGKGIRVTIETKIESILILLEMLKHSAIDGEFNFTLEDKSIFSIQLHPKLNRIAGLWESGDVETQQNDKGILVKNISENKIRLYKIRFYKKSDFEEQEINVILESQETFPLIAEIPNNMESWAAYYSQEDAVDINLEQINKYIEDVKCQLIFITMINFKEKKITNIQIDYRLKDATDIFTAALDAVNNNCEKILLMPITNFLVQRIIEFKIKSVMYEGGRLQPGNEVWITHDLASDDNIINIQSNLITTN